MTWRAKDRWLGKDPKVLLEVIEDHFDGLASFVNIRHFGILKGSERPFVICPNSKCSHSFQAFPPTQKCEELV